MTERAEGADLVVIFTCGFIDDAKQEAIDDILAYADLKRRREVRGIAVVGCLPEKYGEELSREMPEVDAFVGNTKMAELPRILHALDRGLPAERLLRGGSHQSTQALTARGERWLPSSRPWTRTVMIADGCDNACTYCAIPHMRGPLRSRPVEEILDEVRALAEQGAKEVVLAGQDTASYGLDGGAVRLGGLIRKVAAAADIPWIRLAYANPETLQADVASAMRDCPNVCHYIDMPIQHASAGVLAAMGRAKGPDAVRQTVENLRRTVPDIAIRTSVIVGFPGETETDLGLLLGFLKEVEFDMVGVFKFSPQPGTPAARLGNRVASAVADERLLEVTALAHDLARSATEAMIGSDLEVLVEGGEDGASLGRSAYDMAEVDRVVKLPGCTARSGEFVVARLRRWLGPYEIEATCLGAVSSKDAGGRLCRRARHTAHGHGGQSDPEGRPIPLDKV